MTEINSWSHATYYFIAAGCFISLKNYERAQKLFDAIPDVLDKKKIGGKDLPTEVFIKKKREFELCGKECYSPSSHASRVKSNSIKTSRHGLQVLRITMQGASGSALRKVRLATSIGLHYSLIGSSLNLACLGT